VCQVGYFQRVTCVVFGSSAGRFRRIAFWVMTRSDCHLNQVSQRPIVSNWGNIFLLTFLFLYYIKSNPSFDCFFVFGRSRFAFWAWRPDLPSSFLSCLSLYPPQSQVMFYSQTLHLGLPSFTYHNFNCFTHGSRFKYLS